LIKHWKALFSVVTTAVVLAAVITPTGASAAFGGVDGDSAGSARTAKAIAGVQVLTPGGTSQVVLSGKTKTGVATVIVCYVSNWGPTRSGSQVRFDLFVSCQGGTPTQLTAKVDMYWFRYNEWQMVPGSDRFCDANGLASVACGTFGPCFQAGTYYDGYALLFAIDELGVSHQAEVYAPPRFVGCTV
jgi:hypothetical protein